MILTENPGDSVYYAERRRRYALIEAKTVTVGTGAPQVIVHNVDVDYWRETIELPEGKFDLTNFMRVARAIREGFGRYWFEGHEYFEVQGSDTN